MPIVLYYNSNTIRKYIQNNPYFIMYIGNKAHYTCYV